MADSGVGTSPVSRGNVRKRRSKARGLAANRSASASVSAQIAPIASIGDVRRRCERSRDVADQAVQLVGDLGEVLFGALAEGRGFGVQTEGEIRFAGSVTVRRCFLQGH